MRVKVKSSRAPGALARGGPNRLIYCCLFDRPRLALSRPPGEIVGPQVDCDRGEAHHDADPEDRRVMDRPSLLRWLHAFPPRPSPITRSSAERKIVRLHGAA